MHVIACLGSDSVISQNQFRLLRNASGDLAEVFEDRLRSAGVMIAMLDDWDNPHYLTRIWYMHQICHLVLSLCVLAGLFSSSELAPISCSARVVSRACVLGSSQANMESAYT